MRNLVNDLKRAIISKNFTLAMVAVFFMYLQDGYETLQGGSSDVLSLYLQISTIGSLHWLVPCVGVITFAGCYVRDKNDQCYRYFQIRLGTMRYCTSKAVSCYVSAWLATCSGIILFLLIACGVLGLPDGTNPLVSGHARMANTLSLYSLLGEGRYTLFILLRVSLTGMCAGLWGLFGLMVSSFWPNIYVALFSPVIVAYFKDYLYAWIHLSPPLRLKALEWCEYNIPGVAKGY